MNLIGAIEAVQATYDRPPDFVGPQVDHPIRVHFTEVEGVLVVTPEGSKTEADWLGNIDVWSYSELYKNFHPEFGWHHYDFLVSTESALETVADRVGSKRYIIAGHSRGATQGIMLAGLMALRKVPPVQVFALEPPRGFFLKIPALYDDIAVEGSWNGNDPVPFVPLGWEQFKLHTFGASCERAVSCHHLDSVLANAKLVQQKGALQ